MILSAIWNKIISTSKIFQRLTKLNKSVGQVQFGVFEKFTSFLRCLSIILNAFIHHPRLMGKGGALVLCIIVLLKWRGNRFTM